MSKRRTNTKSILEQNRDKIVSEYLAGKSTCQLSRELDVHSASVWAFLKNKCGITPPKHNNKYVHHKDEMVRLFNDGKSLGQIAEIIGCGRESIGIILKREGLDTSKHIKRAGDLFKNSHEEIVKDYLSGTGCTVLSQKYECGESSILRVLRRNNIEIRENRDIFFNQDLFEVIDEPYKAWMLGWWTADGNVGNKLTYSTISITDLEIIEKFIEWSGYTGDYRTVAPRKHNHKMQYRLVFSSTKMANDLNNLGVIPKKTFFTSFPEDKIAPHCFSHYVRGLLEADGTLGVYDYIRADNSKKGIKLQCNIVGCDSLLNPLSYWLNTKLGLNSTVTVFKPYKGRIGGKIGRLSICSRSDIKVFLEWLYQDCGDLFLKRKKDKADQMLEAIREQAKPSKPLAA